MRNVASVLCTRFRSSESNAVRSALLEAAGIPSTPHRLTTDDAWNTVFRCVAVPCF